MLADPGQTRSRLLGFQTKPTGIQGRLLLPDRVSGDCVALSSRSMKREGSLAFSGLSGVSCSTKDTSVKGASLLNMIIRNQVFKTSLLPEIC